MAEQIPKILVVEDHPDTLEVLGLYLELLGFRCVLVRDAGSALARAAVETFAAILTDVNLTGRDGWELLRELTARGQLPPIVLSMSAGDDYVQARTSAALGCHAHLVKPFRHGEFEAVLSQHLPCPASEAWGNAPENL